ncbi:hypothetical protein RAB80_016095 [Fusarium oxysporum f. sp. vasinfectum]|nr:hypothetical protein RAB80_016095 [Fusarium oxysporum f. sp. vasinfectum]
MSVMSQDVVEYYYRGHRLADSIEDWAEEVSSATEEMEFVEPIKPQAKMPRIGDASKEIQIAILLERHNEAREIMKLIEEQLLKLGCEIPQGAISKSSSSKHGGLNHQGGSHREYFTEDSEAQGLLSQDTWAYIPLDKLRKGSKDLFQALELLRTAPDEQALSVLERLRSSDSVSEFLQVLDSGVMKPPSPINPLDTSLVGTSASSTIELDLNMRYSSVFPTLETLDIKDVDLGLLAVNKRALASSNQQAAAPLTPFTPIEFGQSSETPTTSESFSTPSDTTGDTGVDPRLESLQIWQWTSVPVPENLAAQAISFYLVNEHPLLALFDADLFIRDFVAGGGRFCSQLLVSSLLAWACASYSQFEPRAQTLSLAFLREAKRRWKDLTDHTAITTLSSAMLLVLTCNQHGQDKVGLFYLDASVQIGRRLGLFGDEETSVPNFNDDDELRTAASFAAWGTFGWHSEAPNKTSAIFTYTRGMCLGRL